MDTLMTAIALWLSAQFDLPATDEHPKIELVSPGEMIEVRAAILETEEDKERLRAALGHGDCRSQAGHGLVALYDDTSRTVYLPQDWSASSPVDVSVLIHEMVHHLQNVGGVEYPCEEGREYPAYSAQKA